MRSIGKIDFKTDFFYFQFKNLKLKDLFTNSSQTFMDCGHKISREQMTWNEIHERTNKQTNEHCSWGCSKTLTL